MRLALAILLVVAAAAPAAAVDKPKNSGELRERINKAWDERLERIWRVQVEAGCKAEAKKQYTAIHFRKRRVFVRNCIEQAHR